MKMHSFDERRLIALCGDEESTIAYAVEHWIDLASQSIDEHGFFSVALSGGSTPKKIYQMLSGPQRHAVDWENVFLFWSDERCVAPTHEESNYRMAMAEGGFSKLPIPQHNIFRMMAEENIADNALLYESLIKKKLGGHFFDLVMLGMGEDGHTASLFPHTKALSVTDRLVVPNYIPQKKTWRMTMTFPCINSSRQICLYVIGQSKAETLAKVLTSPFNPEEFPSQNVGTSSNRATWILDDAAGKNILGILS